MSDTEAERAFEKWADSPHGRIPSSAPEAHEGFLAGFQAGQAAKELEFAACPVCMNIECFCQKNEEGPCS